jgi:cytochrome c553
MRTISLHWIVAGLLAASLAHSAESARQELERARALQADAVRGEQLFAQCTACHGPEAGGTQDGSVPRIAGQHYPVLLKQLVDFRHGKRWDFRMEERADRHHLPVTQDLADVAVFISDLDVSNPPGMGEGTNLAAGASLYESRCRSCHGVDGAGDGARLVPRLAGQHYGYLMRQMYDAVDGRRPTLQRYHTERLEPLDFAQVRALSDYLSRLKPVAAAQ